MKEIKFRAWDSEHNCMNKSPFVVSNDGKVFDEYHGGGYVKKHFVLMQYTGLKDKNGKEIYEGDIVTHDNKNGTKGIVEYKRAGFSVRETGVFKGMWSAVDDSGWEIIGNIYENPELLENK